MLASRIEDPDSIGGGDPDVSSFIGLEAVGNFHVRENTAFLKTAVSLDIEYAHLLGTTVGYVQLLLIGRERDATGGFALFARHSEIALASDLIEQQIGE